jgi:hypothetical protein
LSFSSFGSVSRPRFFSNGSYKKGAKVMYATL